MSNTYSLHDALSDLAAIWNKLNKRQQNSIAKLIAGVKEKDSMVSKNQITIDEFITELEEDYRRKVSGGN